MMNAPPDLPDLAHLPDPELLEAVARMWEAADPPPADLADGVLARLAAQDLDVELLTLVETDLAGVRHASAEPNEDAGSWTLDYAGEDFRAYLRISRIEDETRLDGWVVPARVLRVELRPEQDGELILTELDEFGRFEVPTVASGLYRLAFLEPDDPETPGARPRLTPPFWI